MSQEFVHPPTIYKQGNPPDQTASGPDGGQVFPIPWIDDLWVDITNHLIKRCTSQNPYTWVSIESPGGGASTNDPFITWTTAGDLTNNKVIGSFLTSVLQTAMPISRGGTVVSPTAPANIIVWEAPFSCTVTAVRGYTSGSTGSTVNAQRNGVDALLASDLTLSAADNWIDGGAVQNTAFVSGDKLEIMLTGISGTPSEIAVQVNFTRP